MNPELSIDKEKLREDALEKNDAQAIFETFLKKFPKRSRELIWSGRTLHGSLNLACLEEFRVRKLKTILFRDGCITDLKNIPDGIELLHCEGNLLRELPALPASLKQLHLKSNLIEKLNLSPCKQLESLTVSYNRLTELPNLPETLQTLLCDHNQIRTLDLKPNIHLTILHCQNNPDLTLHHIPESVVQGEYPVLRKTGASSIESKSIKSNEKLKEDLGKYFQIKTQYEKKYKQLRETRTQELPKCIGCQKPVGMLFSSKYRKYQARCGGNPPCEWKIEIARGQYVPREDVLYTYLQDVESMKQKIIEQKMITLFRHMGEQKASELFQEQMKAYESANKYLEELKREQNELYNNEDIQEKIDQYQLEINQALQQVKIALKEGNIDEAVEIQYRTIQPKSQMIQRLQYEYMKMVNNGHSILLQEPVSLHKTEIRLDVV